MELPFYDHGTIRPDQVRHRLTEDGWSGFVFGDRRIEIPRDDLEKVQAARELAVQIAAEAAFWEKDLAAIEAALTQTPGPSSDPTTAPDEPFGGDDPELDAAVARVAELADAHRQPEEEGDL